MEKKYYFILLFFGLCLILSGCFIQNISNESGEKKVIPNQPTQTPVVTLDPSAAISPTIDPALLAQCTGTSPITLHLDLDIGNYNVTTVIGDAASSGNTIIQAEARRFLSDDISTESGNYSQLTFTVNVRYPDGEPTGQNGTGTTGLDLIFSGSNPKISGIGIAAVANPLVVYLAGDSTVCDQRISPYTGWGQMLPKYFTIGTSIANYSDSGENSYSFYNTTALWGTMSPLIKAGDYVFIQFGHNDKTTDANTYKNYLTNYVVYIKQQKAIPVLVTPPVRRIFNSDGITLSSSALHVNSLGVDLPAAMKEVAAANNVPLIDMTTKSKILVESLGSTGSKQLYLTAENNGVNDNTHFCEYGANEMAKLVIQGMQELNLPLVSQLRP